MSLIRRQWTAQAADEWGKEDWIAIGLSVLSYFTLTVGTALSFLLIPSGFVILAFGIGAAILMYWVIDPKLRTISSEYEKKQKDYLRKLEEIQEWRSDQ
ncbi:MAG: hypothetical protein V3U24_04315 [Candidatus Neomarinimicrobiota bacterium]